MCIIHFSCSSLQATTIKAVTCVALRCQDHENSSQAVFFHRFARRLVEFMFSATRRRVTMEEGACIPLTGCVQCRVCDATTTLSQQPVEPARHLSACSAQLCTARCDYWHNIIDFQQQKITHVVLHFDVPRILPSVAFACNWDILSGRAADTAGHHAHLRAQLPTLAARRRPMSTFNRFLSSVKRHKLRDRRRCSRCRATILTYQCHC